MSNLVYSATSIDGYIAREDGSIDWLMDIPNPSDSDYGYSDFIKRVDGIIMGRNTFQTAIGFNEWPYLKPVFILTNTLKQIPKNLSGKVEIVTGELTAIIDKLKLRGFHNLYVDGGKTIQSFLQMDMIDELIITRIPLVLGSGIPLFSKNIKELKFEHVKTDVYNNILVKSHYVRRR